MYKNIKVIFNIVFVILLYKKDNIWYYYKDVLYFIDDKSINVERWIYEKNASKK